VPVDSPGGSTLQQGMGRGLLCLTALASFFLFISYKRDPAVNYSIESCFSMCVCGVCALVVIVVSEFDVVQIFL